MDITKKNIERTECAYMTWRIACDVSGGATGEHMRSGAAGASTSKCQANSASAYGR